MGWAGWGAGPSGAGAAGTSRIFLGLMALVSGGLAVAVGLDHKWPSALVLASAAGYFAVRLLMAGGREKR